jgi:hypothetical protein
MIGLDRIEAAEPLERTTARSIPKPCLEAGHRIVPTYQPVHVGSDRTDRSSVLISIVSHQTVNSQQVRPDRGTMRIIARNASQIISRKTSDTDAGSGLTK